MQENKEKKVEITDTKSNNKKGNNIFDICLIIICMTSVLSFIIVQFIFPGIREHNINNILSKYDKSKEYSFMYYDYMISDKNKEILEKTLSENKDVVKLLKNNNIRIAVTDKKVQEVVKDITVVNPEMHKEAVGAFIEKLDIIILNPYKYSETLKEELKKEKDKLEKNLEFLDTQLNKNLLLHEIGHFLDSLGGNKLEENKEMQEAFEKEKDIVILELTEYPKSNIKEYIAECISYYLMYGKVEVNEGVEENSTQTSKLIKETVDRVLKSAN